MLRKFSLVAVAAASLAAALAPTSASAWGGWHGGWHGGGWHRGFVGPRFYVGGPAYYGYGGCYVRRVVPTPWGPRCAPGQSLLLKRHRSISKAPALLRRGFCICGQGPGSRSCKFY